MYFLYFNFDLRTSKTRRLEGLKADVIFIHLIEYSSISMTTKCEKILILRGRKS